MWKPTHVQITVLRAKNLLRKGKGGTNSSFVTIQLGKDKFQTSVQENTEEPVWEEECDLTYREELQECGAILLVVFHRNFFGLDEFLGQVSLPLAHFGVYDTPKSKWYRLRSKQSKKEEKERGELEVRLAYVVRDTSTPAAETPSGDSARIKKLSGSLLDLASNVGHKIQKLPARSLSLKLDRLDPRLRLDRIRHRRLSVNEDLSSLSLTSTPTSGAPAGMVSLEPAGQEPQTQPERPRSLRLRSSSLSRLQEPRSFGPSRDTVDSPFLDQDLPSITESPLKQNLNNKNLNNLNNRLRPGRNSNSFSKLTTLVESSLRRTISVPDAADLSLAIRTGRTFAVPPDDWEHVCQTNSLTSPMTPDPVPMERRKSRLRKLRNEGRRHTIQEFDLPDHLKEEGDVLSGEEEHNNRLDNMNSLRSCSADILDQYERMNHTELLELLITQQELLQNQESKIRDLELYIDNLLLRVMETTPRILQNPYKPLDPAFYRRNFLQTDFSD